MPVAFGTVASVGVAVIRRQLVEIEELDWKRVSHTGILADSACRLSSRKRGAGDRMAMMGSRDRKFRNLLE